MKRFIWNLLYYSGVHVLIRTYARDTFTIVLYHGVDEARDMGSYNYRGKFITPQTFEQHLLHYKQKYNVLPLDEAVQRLVNGKPLPPHALSITFDDGYRNNYTHAFPLLKKHKLPATIFITTDFVDKNIPLWVDRLEYAVNTGTCFNTTPEKVSFDLAERLRLKALSHTERMQAVEEIETRCGAKLKDFTGDQAVYAPLTWNDVEEMSGHDIMFGAHTESHPILSTVSQDNARREITTSRTVLEKKCKTVSSVFAYPNGQAGDMNDDTCAIVRDTGFMAALTTLPGHNKQTADRWLLKRYTLDASESFPFFVTTVTGTRHIITSFIKRHAKRS